ncbi:MAG: hypothetical protein HS113_04695 [Verrucomicrobiales bacterium]|nr:hypothetical protein [Verrucomicrobiales bacterium]
MNNEPEFELDLDLQMLPAWARQPSAANRYAQYEGGGEGPRERGRGGPPFRRDRGPGGERRGRGGPGEGRPRREGPREGPRGGMRGGPGRERRDEGRREEPRESEPLPEVLVNLVPERKGIELLARQIKLTGRAYPLFQVASLVLHKPERFEVQFTTKKGPEGNILQALFVCALDDTLWLSEEEVAQHALRHHFDTFYQTEKVATDPPKGTYTLVAQCGMSGTLLGPPNYHDYQTKLRKLHADRFARMPFEAYKAKVKFVKDEAVVKQWLDEQSFKAEYVGLNLPEPLRFLSRDDAEKHFREVHLPNLVKSVESFTLAGVENQRFMSRGLRSLLRHTLEEQRRFPLKVATVLSQQLAGQGLHFFKVNRTVTHVCVARPHYLDLTTTSVSESVRKIVEYIDSHPNCTRRRLLDALAPSPPTPAQPAAPAPAPAAPSEGGVGTEQTAATAAAQAPATPAPTPEQTAVVTDLHWLIHQGHVIEFTDGRMETAKPPKPKPPTPPRAPAKDPGPETKDHGPRTTEQGPETTDQGPQAAEEGMPAASAETPAEAPAGAVEAASAPAPAVEPAPAGPEVAVEPPPAAPAAEPGPVAGEAEPTEEPPRPV